MSLFFNTSKKSVIFFHCFADKVQINGVDSNNNKNIVQIFIGEMCMMGGGGVKGSLGKKSLSTI
jgi:hypothetical protein